MSGFDFAGVGQGVGGVAGAAASLIGGLGANAENAANNAAQQAEFQTNLQNFWTQFNTGEHQDIFERVQAAHDYGLSPLVTLGAPTWSPPAMSVGESNFTPSSNPAYGLADALGRAGQGLGQAFSKQMTEQQLNDYAMKVRSMADEHDKTLAQTDMYRAVAMRNLVDAQGRPAAPSAVPVSGGLAGQQGIDKSQPEVVPGFDWQIQGNTAQRVPTKDLMASASIFNPEYWRFAGRNILTNNTDDRPPPMESLPSGAVRWVKEGGGVYRASSYYDWEEPGRRSGITITPRGPSYPRAGGSFER